MDNPVDYPKRKPVKKSGGLWLFKAIALLTIGGVVISLIICGCWPLGE